MTKWVKQLKTILELSIRECAWCGNWEHCISTKGKICPCKECIVKITCAVYCEPLLKYSALIQKEIEEEVE